MGKLKKAVKAFLDENVGAAALKFEDLPQKAEYVSFDIFDTLVVRDINKPSELFSLIEKSSGIEDFAQKRITAEQAAREKKHGGEVTLCEIYRCFPGIAPDEADKYCRRELEAELSVCRANPAMIGFYRKCVKNKKVVLISDMYLTGDMMRRILDKCGITGYEKLYISCDTGVSKRGGELYRHVLSDLGIKPDDMIHIGNDIMSDALKARKENISCRKLRTGENRLLAGKAAKKRAGSNRQFSDIYNFINNTTRSNKKFKSFYYRFGYENFGILLMGFCKWLFNEAEKQGIEQMLFIARDGYIIKKAYDLMGLSEKIPSYYFEVSRRSIRVPVSFSSSMSYEDSLKLVSVTRRISVGQLLDSWGIDIESHLPQLKAAGISPDAVFWEEKLRSSAALKKLYGLVRDDIISNALAEKAAAEQYLDKFGLERPTALVDIGYCATMQKEISKIMASRGKKCDLYGYYMIEDEEGVSKNTGGLPLNIKGYTVTNSGRGVKNLEINQYVGIFETMFLEQTGSAKRYTCKNGEVCIEKYGYEYDAPGEKVNETERVALIQRGALDFIRAAMRESVGQLNAIDSENAFFLLDRAFSKPTDNILTHFYNFRFFNMGEAGFLAMPRTSLKGCCLHPEQLKKDFFASMWKTGFLKKLLGLNIPFKALRDAYQSFRHRNEG